MIDIDKTFSISKTIHKIEDYIDEKFYLNTEPVTIDKPFYNILKPEIDEDIKFVAIAK